MSEAPDRDRVPSDAVLVARTLDGDAAAFGALVDRYYAPCSRYAYRMLGHRQDGEDAIQETFARVHLALRGYDERQNFRAWLYRVLLNECRSLARRRTRRARWLVENTNAAERVAARATEPDADLRDALQVLLDGLEPLLREAFLLHYGEQLEYGEMSNMTGASVSALKMRVKRARDAMRPALEALFDG